MLPKWTIAVPESRQLDIMARLLENRGAQVMRVPMVAIHDAPDAERVLSWIRQFIENPPSLMIVYTGEGMRRLLALAEKNSLKERFVISLGQVQKLCRGPKPVRVLRELALDCEVPALAPTTDGVIASLKEMDIDNCRVGVQLYGEEPNQKLMDYLNSRHVVIEQVAPYVYADEVEADQVLELIRALDSQALQAIAFTSQAQFKRLQQVAKSHSMEKLLLTALAKVRVAVVGPLVKEQLEAAGVRVDIMPERAFFMKPLVSAIIKNLASSPLTN